jgi:RNA polymerase sigma-70 factor (ECF subfamily)
VLKEYEGLTFLEISEILGVPLSTVKTRLYRGLVHLRAHLERANVRGATPLPTAIP